MTIYQELQPIFPYLTSIRKLKNYISFDITFPLNWVLPKKYVDESSVVENESDDPNVRFFSFVSQFDDDSLSKVSISIQNVIKYNLEKEEKQKLFQDKVTELKTLFEGQSLENLKNLVFELEKSKINKSNGRQIKTVKMVREDEDGGQIGNLELQESDN